jgi:hypothetical protein
VDVVEEDVRALLFGGSVTPPPETSPQPGEALASLAGEYESPTGARWRVSAAADALVLEPLTPPALELQAGKLGGDQKLIVRQSAKILAGLTRADFGEVRQLDETSRLQGIEGWWRGLVELHGRLESSTLLGLIQDSKLLNHVVARLEFERGEELLDLTWGDELFIGLHTGPPYASRLRLVPAEDGFVAYDLVSRKRRATARSAADGTLELDLPGGKTAARRF